MDNNMIEKLKSMLDDPETMNAVSSLLGNIQPSDATEYSSATEETDGIIPAPITDNQAESIAKIKQVIEQASPANDPRINLLTSLKPYMGKSRSAKMDQAIRLIQISKMASIFKL